MKIIGIIRKSLIMVLVVILVSMLTGVGAQAKTHRWVIGGGHPAFGATGKLMNEWFPNEMARRIEAATGDKIKWVKAFGGSVAKVGDELEAMESGILTFAPILYMFEPAKLPLGNFAYQTPFSTTDTMLAAKIGYQMHMDIPFMQEALAKYNIKFVSMMAFDSYQLITTFPVRKVDDIKNKKISGSGPNLAWIKSVGAVPVQSNLVEGYTSMQTGVYKGQLAFTTAAEAFKFQDVAKFQADVDFGAFPMSGFGMNLDTFNSLPVKVQKIIVDLGQEFTFKYAQTVKDSLKAAKDRMKKAGVTFYQFSVEERQKWAEALPDIPGAFINKYEAKGMPAREVITYWINGLENNGYKFPRKWEIK